MILKIRQDLSEKKKLNDSSNVSKSSTGVNESRIFQIAPDSNNFGNVSMTVTFLSHLIH